MTSAPIPRSVAVPRSRDRPGHVVRNHGTTCTRSRVRYSELVRTREWGMGSPMRKQYQRCRIYQGRGGEASGGRRATRRIAGPLFARLPLRIVVPFLLFWSLGSVVLGHELASLPLASFASAVTRPLQATLQAQGAFPRAETPGKPATRPQVAAGGLGSKPPIIAKHPVAAHAKTRVRMQRRNITSTAYTRNGSGQIATAFETSDDWQPGAFAYGLAGGTPPWLGPPSPGWFARPSVFRWGGSWQSPCDWTSRSPYAWP